MRRILHLPDKALDSGVLDRRPERGNSLPAGAFQMTGGPTRNYRRRQLAQDPDGLHVYLATAATETAHIDAVHILERATAMQPDEKTPR